MFPIISSEKSLFKIHKLIITTKISLHVNKNLCMWTKNRQERRKAAIVLRYFIFPSNVTVVDICGFCLASSHSPFFCNILVIFLWETTPPCLSAMWFG